MKTDKEVQNHFEREFKNQIREFIGETKIPIKRTFEQLESFVRSFYLLEEQGFFKSDSIINTIPNTHENLKKAMDVCFISMNVIRRKKKYEQKLESIVFKSPKNNKKVK